MLWERWRLSPSHSQSLLPGPGTLILDRVERDADRFRLVVHVEQEPVCPLCGEVSRSRHSCYCRCLQDLPWQGVSVQLWATVGRFRCRNPACPRKIFCERLPRIARVYGRQTERAAEIVRLIGYVAGGLPGQRLLDRLSIATSDDTVLRRVREILRKRAPVPCRTWESTIGLGAKAKSMERFWSIWTCTAWWTSFRIEPPTASPNGCGSIRKS